MPTRIKCWFFNPLSFGRIMNLNIANIYSTFEYSLHCFQFTKCSIIPSYVHRIIIRVRFLLTKVNTHAHWMGFFPSFYLFSFEIVCLHSVRLGNRPNSDMTLHRNFLCEICFFFAEFHSRKMTVTSRFYQVRCSLRVSPRISVQIEASVLESLNKEITSATVIRGAGTSKIFQILYRNEEVILRDTVLFRVRLPGKNLLAFNWLKFIVPYWQYSEQ